MSPGELEALPRGSDFVTDPSLLQNRPPIIFPRVLSLCTKGRLCWCFVLCLVSVLGTGRSLCRPRSGREWRAVSRRSWGSACSGAERGPGGIPLPSGSLAFVPPFSLPSLAPVEPCQIRAKAAGPGPWHRSRVGMEQRALAVAECD